MRHLPAALLALPLAATTALAQGGGKVSCHTSSEFLVVVRERTDQVGSDFLTRRKPARPEACAFKEEPGDFRIGSRDLPYNYFAVGRKYLVIESQTGPSGDLVVYDLAERKRILSQRMTAASQTKLDGDKVRFTLRTGEGNAGACRDWAQYKKNGGTGELGVPASFSFTTGEVTRGTETTCTYAQ